MTKSIVRSILAASAIIVFPACSSSDPEGTPETDAGSIPTADGATTADAANPPIPCGRNSTLCTNGSACEGAPDCLSGLCREGLCQEVSPADGIQNADETDVDCGGTKAPACADGKKCAVAPDCTSSVCTGGICQVPSPTDTVKNGDETDVDCGGSKAPKCATGKGCKVSGDCDNVLCDPTTKKCAAPSDSDQLKNGDETGIDCGGPTTPKKCPPGQGCAGDGDCDNTRCNVTTNVCDPPTKTDGLKNGTETDVDCGGGAPTNADRCKEGKTCAADGDCADPFCSIANTCVSGRSCKGTVGNATSGIVTCGPNDLVNGAPRPGFTGATETCCRSLPLPTTPTVRLDKYEVTSGRFRQFLESVGPNVRQWAKNEINNNTPVGQRLANDVPSVALDLFPSTDAPGVGMNLVMQVGGTVMDSRRPSANQGCYSDNGSYGHNTYYWPRATLQAHFGNGHSARRFTQAQYDEKSMNCSPYWMYAAFCAWDGGRLPTGAEINQVWTTTYPWGAAYGGAGKPVAPANGIDYKTTVNQNNNNLFFYAVPGFGDANDLAGYIAAPGRFFLDATTAQSTVDGVAQSWIDLAANNIEMVRYNTTSGTEAFCDFNVFDGEVTTAACNDGGTLGVLRAAAVPKAQWVGGSWEGHGIGKSIGNFGIQIQYGKTGFRCAR